MKNLKIAFVGLDGTGKTTIARGLSRLLGIPYFKDSMYKEIFFNNSDYAKMTGDFLLDLLRQTNQPLIMDRCFLLIRWFQHWVELARLWHPVWEKWI